MTDHPAEIGDEAEAYAHLVHAIRAFHEAGNTVADLAVQLRHLLTEDEFHRLIQRLDDPA